MNEECTCDRDGNGMGDDWCPYCDGPPDDDWLYPSATVDELDPFEEWTDPRAFDNR